MNEKINLCKILKNCPKGKVFYSSVYGNIIFDSVYKHSVLFNKDGFGFIILPSNGKLIDSLDNECIVFPSKHERDWDKWYYNHVIKNIIKYKASLKKARKKEINN